MSDRPPKILLVEPDPAIVELLVETLRHHFDAVVTCVAGAEACLGTDLYDPHDLVIAEWTLEDSDGLELTEHLHILSPRPVILLVDEPTSEDTVAALRAGVCDVFVKPFSISDLIDAADRALKTFQLKRRQAAKYRRMRELVRRVIRERRDLNHRMELVCKDLVEAHRRLAQRVLSLDASNPGPAL